jgi:hypothetical protein
MLGSGCRDLPDHTAQVALGLDILTDAEIAGALLEEGVLHYVNIDSSATLIHDRNRECRRFRLWGRNIPCSWCSSHPSQSGTGQQRLSFLSEAVIEKKIPVSKCFFKF